MAFTQFDFSLFPCTFWRQRSPCVGSGALSLAVRQAPRLPAQRRVVRIHHGGGPLAFALTGISIREFLWRLGGVGDLIVKFKLSVNLNY